MEKKDVINILEKIKICLDRNSIYEAKEYIRIEIENLKDITPKKCEKKGRYCAECSNLNCSKNVNNK